MSSSKRNSATWTSISTLLLLVSLVVLSAICFVTGFLFLWQDKAGAWAPLIIGLLILAASLAGWFIVQKETDYTEPETTSVSDNQGNQIVTQTHALESPMFIQNLGTLLQQMPRHEAHPEKDIEEDSKDDLEDDLEDEESPAPTSTMPTAEVHPDKAEATQPA